MPVPTAETEPTGQARPTKLAKPFTYPLMARSLGKAVEKPVVASKDDGESDGSMSEGEIRLAALAMTELVKACDHSVRQNFELAEFCPIRQNKVENTGWECARGDPATNREKRVDKMSPGVRLNRAADYIS
jgi:hypothetical protein